MLTEAVRGRDFPSLAGMTYLNSAAEGIPPLAVGAALQQYFADKQLGMDASGTPRSGTPPNLVAEFYGLTASEVSICSCSSEAYNLAAAALHLQAGDEIVINDLDFPASHNPVAPTQLPRHGQGLAEPGRGFACRGPYPAIEPRERDWSRRRW